MTTDELSFRCPRCQSEYDADPRLSMLCTYCPHCGSSVWEQMCVRIVIPLKSAAWERAWEGGRASQPTIAVTH